jgi:hypothetical protein
MSHFGAEACPDFPLSLPSETHAGIAADKVNECLLIDSPAAGDPAICGGLTLANRQRSGLTPAKRAPA